MITAKNINVQPKQLKKARIKNYIPKLPTVLNGFNIMASEDIFVNRKSAPKNILSVFPLHSIIHEVQY